MRPIFNTAIIVSLFLSCGCTKNFDELNVDPTRLTNIGPAELPFLFSKAQSAASYPGFSYQGTQTQHSDLWVQYYAVTATYFNSDRYVMSLARLTRDWLPAYTEVVPQLKTIFANTDVNSPEYALASIWWVYTFHRLTDYYGPVPYFNAGEALKSVPYDSQEDIYNDFFKRLKDALAVLKNNAAVKPYGNYDLMYGGNLNKWIKFANTLRLRLAMRISKIKPDLAKTEAESAVSGGVLTEKEDNAFVTKSQQGSDFNGLATVALFGEFRMSASMESVLKGYNDPRMGIYFQPASANGNFDGLRNGLFAVEQNILSNTPDYTSNVGTTWAVRSSGTWSGQLTAPQNIMVSAEAFLLRAEGALYGWEMNGTAKSLYEDGIRASMKHWGIVNDAAINNYINSDAVPVAPQDSQNSPPMNDYPIKFSNDPGMQIKQIGQQKWLALFPDGKEAWADRRRLNYPELYPVVHSDNADLPFGTFIKRTPFLDIEKQANKAAVDAAVSKLNGPDKVNTPLWWDKD